MLQILQIRNQFYVANVVSGVMTNGKFGSNGGNGKVGFVGNLPEDKPSDKTNTGQALKASVLLQWRSVAGSAAAVVADAVVKLHVETSPSVPLRFAEKEAKSAFPYEQDSRGW